MYTDSRSRRSFVGCEYWLLDPTVDGSDEPAVSCTLVGSALSAREVGIGLDAVVCPAWWKWDRNDGGGGEAGA